MTTFGLQLPSFTFPDVPDDRLFDRITEIAQAAEGSGFDSFWVMDHYHQIRNIGPASDPMLEAYTILGAVAARTSRVKLGAMVTGRDVPEPGVPGQGGHDARRHLVGARDPGHRRRVERRGVPRVRLRLAVDGRAVRAAGGRAADLPADVHAAAVDVRGEAAPHRGRVQRPAAGAAGRAEDPDRRRRREEDAPAWSRGTRTCGTGSAIPTRSVTRSRCWRITARTSAAIRRRSRRRAWGRCSSPRRRTKRSRDARSSRRVVASTTRCSRRPSSAGFADQVGDAVQAFIDAGLDGLIFNMPPGSTPEEVERAGRTLTERFGA